MEEKQVPLSLTNKIVDKDVENGQVSVVHSSREKWKQVVAAFSVCFLCIVAGETLGFTSTAIVSMKEDGNFPDLTPEQISWIGGLTPLGALAGSILCIVIIRCFGSRYTILFFASPIFLISHLIIAFASTSVDTIFIGRFLGGIGIGLTISSSPLYVVEVASDKNRGRLGILPQFLLIFGLWLSNFFGTFLDWQGLSIAFFVTALPSIPLLLWAPNSPSYIGKKLNKKIGRFSSNTKNRDQLLLVMRTEKDCQNNFIQDPPSPPTTPSSYPESNDPMRSSRLNETSSSNNNNNEDDVSGQLISPVLKKEEESGHELAPHFVGRRSKIDIPTVKACAVALGLMSFQQLTGINGVAFFAVTIFKQSSSTSSGGGGGHSIDPYLAAIFLISVQLVAVFISTCLVERLGRKILLLVSSGLLSLSAGGLATYYNFCNHMTTITANNNTSVEAHLLDMDMNMSCANLYWLPLTFLVSYVFAFAIGYGPISWIILTEILPANVRNLMNPLAIGYSWFCVFLVTTSFPILMIKIELVGIFFLYGGIGVLGFIFIFICVPETKGKSLNEVQAFFGRRV